MEIDKILFGQLSQSKGINNPFEDLDVNGDGKINNTDLNIAENSEIKSAISNVLNMVDEEENIQIIDESMQKTSSSKTGNANYASDLSNNLTWTTDSFFDSIDLSVTTWYQSGLKSDTNFKNIKNQMLSDPLLSQKLSSEDISKIKNMIADSKYKVYAADFQAILDAVESKQDSIQKIKDNLTDSELQNGKSVTVNVNYQYDGGNNNVTIQNVNGTYVYKFSGNNNSNFSLTDSQLDKIMSVINSNENFKNMFQYMLQTNISDPGGNWNNNIKGLQNTFAGTQGCGQSFMDAIASALNTTANVGYDNIMNHGKYVFTNELGQSSNAKFCVSCRTAPEIFLADIFKALQAREMLNVAKNGDSIVTSSSTTKSTIATNTVESQTQNSESASNTSETKTKNSKSVSNTLETKTQNSKSVSNTKNSLIELKKNKLDSLTQEKDELTQEQNKIEQEYKDKQKEIKEKELQYKELKNKLDSDPENIDLLGQISELSDEIKMLNNQALNLFYQTNQLERKYTSLSNHIALVTSEIMAIDGSNGDTKNSI